MRKLFCFGYGYSALAAARLFIKEGGAVAGTVRGGEKRAALAVEAFAAVSFEDARAVKAELANTTHLLVSAPPKDGKDPVLTAFSEAIMEAPALQWIGYLSTIGVYGDQGGAWVEETTPLTPKSARAKARVAVENAWIELAARRCVSLDVFRLAGIYGPGRSPIDKIADGTAVRIDKPSQVFNRIHVEDIAGGVLAAIEHTPEQPGARIFNIADDEPAPQPDVIAYAASLTGAPIPPLVPFEEAVLSPMAASFWLDNKRVRNEKLKRELRFALKYPTYREGLAAIAAERAEGERPSN